MGGFTSTLMCGILATRLKKRSGGSAAAWISMIGAALAIPLMAGSVLFEGVGFNVSMALLALKFLVSEGYMASTVSMM